MVIVAKQEAEDRGLGCVAGKRSRRIVVPGFVRALL
jgi:hypothetical protein